MDRHNDGHQSAVVEALVFSKFLKHCGGSLLTAIQTHYRAQFNLNEKQKEEFKSIEKKAAEEIAAAKERFLKEVERIRQDTKKEINEKTKSMLFWSLSKNSSLSDLKTK